FVCCLSIAQGDPGQDHRRHPWSSHIREHLDLLALVGGRPARRSPARAEGIERLEGGAPMKRTFALRSKLAPAITRYLELNLALGKRYRHELTTFKALDRFLSGLPRTGQDLTAETFHAWCREQSRLTPRVRRNRMFMIQ